MQHVGCKAAFEMTADVCTLRAETPLRLSSKEALGFEGDAVLDMRSTDHKCSNGIDAICRTC